MGGEGIELGSTQQSPLRWLDARAVLPICWTRSVLVPTRSQGALNEPPATYPSEPWPSVHTGSHRGQPHIPMCARRELRPPGHSSPLPAPQLQAAWIHVGVGAGGSADPAPPLPPSSWQDYDLDSQRKRRGLRLPHRRQDLLRHHRWWRG